MVAHYAPCDALLAQHLLGLHKLVAVQQNFRKGLENINGELPIYLGWDESDLRCLVVVRGRCGDKIFREGFG